MNITYRYLLIITFTAIISCTGKKRFNLNGTVAKQYPVSFLSSQPSIYDHKIYCNIELRAKPNGDTILFASFIENNSNDTITINPGDLQIETSKNIRSDVTWYVKNKLVIHPKSVDTSFFMFSPFNNLTLFNRIDYNGDMDSVYYITINFIHKYYNQKLFGERIKFSLDKENYNKYINQYALEKKIKLYRIKKQDTLKEKLISNVKEQNKIRHKKNGSNNVEISSSDIMIEGAVIRLNFYSLDSDLFLQGKIINHGENVIKLNPLLLTLKVRDKIINPHILSILNSVSPLDTVNYYIIRGGRLEMKLKYDSSANPEFSLLNKGLIFQDINKEVFPEPLYFVEDTISFKGY